MCSSWRERHPGPAAKAARFSRVAVWFALAATVASAGLWIRGHAGARGLFGTATTLTLTFLLSIAWAATSPSTEAPSRRVRWLCGALGVATLAWAVLNSPLGWMFWLEVPAMVRGGTWLVGFGGLWLLKRVTASGKRVRRNLGPTGL
jgi:hypothetical protein